MEYKDDNGTCAVVRIEWWWDYDENGRNSFMAEYRDDPELTCINGRREGYYLCNSNPHRELLVDNTFIECVPQDCEEEFEKRVKPPRTSRKLYTENCKNGPAK